MVFLSCSTNVLHSPFLYVSSEVAENFVAYCIFTLINYVYISLCKDRSVNKKKLKFDIIMMKNRSKASGQIINVSAL